MTYQTFIISLPDATDRKDHMRKQLAAQNITDYNFIEAVDGRKYEVEDQPIYNAFKRRLFFGRDLKGPEIGVLQSHKKIYERMVADNIPLALVLEDDGLLEPDFKKVIDTLAEKTDSFELARFPGEDKASTLKHFVQHKIIDDYRLHSIRTVPGDAGTYLITLSGAKKMLKILNKIYLPIDTLMGQNWRNNLKAFIVQPRLAQHDYSQDQFIGLDRFDKTLTISGLMKLFFPVTRLYYKAYEGTMKSLWYQKKRIEHALTQPKYKG